MKKFTLVFLFALSFTTIFSQPTVNIIPFATGFSSGITDIVSAGDGRLFIVEQLGYISIVDSVGNVAPELFLNIHNKVTPSVFTAGNEQGLLGLAFSPNYATDGYFYVNYTNKTGVGNTVISRYHVSPDPDSADAASEQVLLTIYQPYTNHNGGSLKFGDDGFLYCGLGDGGLAGDPGNRAQNPDSLLGKILRIDVSGGAGYSIPPTNPFANGGGAPEVWAYGLRNPWRISFDRLVHTFWIADVGQGDWEEINFQNITAQGGENYGWRCYEGNHAYNTSGCGSPSSYISPVYEYSHTATGGCSITGGFVYRGAAFPDLYGYYFYSDYCNGIISSLSSSFVNSTAGTFAGKQFTTFGENNTGELFIGDQSTGTVYRMVSTVTSVYSLPGTEGTLTLYPVPCGNVLNCKIENNKEIKAEIQIVDITGRSYFINHKIVDKGQNNLTIDLKNISAGIYFLKLTTGSGIINKKFEIIK